MRQGQSILEVLVAVALGAFLAGAAAGLIAPTIKTSQQVAQVQAGAALAAELTNNVRVWAEGDWHNIMNLATGSAYHYYLNTNTSPFTSVAGDENVLTNNGTFARYFYLSDVYRDSVGNITSSASNYDISTKQVNVVYTLLNQNGNLGSSWSTGSSNSTTAGPVPAFIYANTLYAVSFGQQALYFAPLNSAGLVGTWNSTTTPSYTGAGAAQYNGYVYAASLGNGSSTATTTVYYAKLDTTNGVSSSWQTTTALPVANQAANVAAYNGYLYVLGGLDGSGNGTSTIWFAPIASGGGLSAWSSTTQLPAVPLAGAYGGQTFYNGKVYFLGSMQVATATVWVATVNSTGSLGAWTAATRLGTAGQRMGILAAGGNLYTVGGEGASGGSSNVVFSSPIATSGALTGWKSPTRLASALVSPWLAANNSYLYAVGGWTGPGSSSLAWTSGTKYINFSTANFASVSSSVSIYLSRNRDTVTTQSDWTGGPGQSGPVTNPTSFFASSTGITYSTPGQLSLSFSNAAGVVTSSFIQVATNTGFGSSIPVSFLSNVTASNTLIVVGYWNTSSTATATLSDTLGNSFTSIGGILPHQNGNVATEMWYATSSAAGADTITMQSTVAQTLALHAYEYGNIWNAYGEDGGVVWSTSSTGASLDTGAITTNHANDLLFGFGVRGAGNMVAGSGFTLKGIAGSTYSEDEIVNATGSYHITMTQTTSSPWEISGAAFALAPASSTVPNISSGTAKHWAWDDSIGWINFYSTNSVVVTNTGIAGYASSSIGDISLDCNTTRNGNICNATNTYQVSNDGSGDLGGWAWNDSVGWIEFFWGNASSNPTSTTSSACQSYGQYCGVYIDSSGQFHGYAWNDTIGWISFNCSNTSGCGISNYYVLTSWIPGGAYGTLDSTVIDTGVSSGAELNSLKWLGTLPAGASVGFQIAVSNASGGPWNFEGPSDDSSTWYTVNAATNKFWVDQDFNNSRYFRYRVELTQGTVSGGNQASTTPIINKIIFNWSP